MRRLVPCLSSLILLSACQSPGAPAAGPIEPAPAAIAPAAIASTAIAPTPTPSPSPRYSPGPVDLGVDTSPPKVVDVNTTPYAPLRFHAGALTPDGVTLKLAAPPGSAGNVIRSFNVTYRYDTPAGGQTETPPVNRPIDAHHVPAGSDVAYGPETSLHVAIGTEALARIAQDRPTQVTATIALIDEQGYEVLDRNFMSIQVPIAIVMD